MRFVVTMERAGRTHRPAPFEVDGDTPDEVAQAIHAHVRAEGWIASSSLDVAVGLPGDPAAVRLYVGLVRDGGAGRLAPSLTCFFIVGERVTYGPPHVPDDEPGEEGVVTSTTARYVFVRFGLTGAKACDPASLTRHA